MSADSSSGYWLAILPWLQLSSEVSLGNLRFVPVKTSQPEAALPELSSISRDCTKVLSSYRLSNRDSITRCTLLIPSDWDLCVLPDGAIQNEFFHAANLLMLAAFALNRYGEINAQNANASMFRLHIAMFSSPPGYLPTYHRLRDGTSATAGAKWGYPLFHVPDECNPPRIVVADERLASSLGCLSNSDDLARRLTLALPFFGWANTLSDTVSLEMEIIALVAALETLFDRSGGYRLGCKVGDLLGPYGSVHVKDAPPTRPNIRPKGRYEAEQEDWYVHRYWVSDLYETRNDLAHAGHSDAEKRAWLPYEHLAMGAFLFPLLVKLLLARDDLYELTCDDKGACDAIDMLLAETDWFTYKHGEDEHATPVTTTWAVTLQSARSERFRTEEEHLAGRILERIKRRQRPRLGPST